MTPAFDPYQVAESAEADKIGAQEFTRGEWLAAIRSAERAAWNTASVMLESDKEEFDFEYQTVGWQWWFNCNSLELADLAKALRAAADAIEGKA